MPLVKPSFELKRPQVGLCFGCSHRARRNANADFVFRAAKRRGERAAGLGRPRAANADVGRSFGSWSEGEAEDTFLGGGVGGLGASSRAEARSDDNENNNNKKKTLYSSKYDKDLTLSLLLPFGEGGLPPRGKTRFRKEEECDPWTQNCKTESHVWESKCDRCFGTGKVISGSRGHYSKSRARRHGSGGGSLRMMSTCVKCTGTGWVRHCSAREIPSPMPNGNPNSPNLAVARRSLSFSESQDFDESE